MRPRPRVERDHRRQEQDDDCRRARARQGAQIVTPRQRHDEHQPGREERELAVRPRQQAEGGARHEERPADVAARSVRRPQGQAGSHESHRVREYQERVRQDGRRQRHDQRGGAGVAGRHAARQRRDQQAQAHAGQRQHEERDQRVGKEHGRHPERFEPRRRHGVGKPCRDDVGRQHEHRQSRLVQRSERPGPVEPRVPIARRVAPLLAWGRRVVVREIEVTVDPQALGHQQVVRLVAGERELAVGRQPPDDQEGGHRNRPQTVSRPCPSLCSRHVGPRTTCQRCHPAARRGPTRARTVGCLDGARVQKAGRGRSFGGPPANLDVFEEALHRVVDGTGERAHEGRNVATLDGVGDGDGVGQQEPDRGDGKRRREGTEHAENAEAESSESHG